MHILIDLLDKWDEWMIKREEKENRLATQHMPQQMVVWYVRYVYTVYVCLCVVCTQKPFRIYYITNWSEYISFCTV